MTLSRTRALHLASSAPPLLLTLVLAPACGDEETTAPPPLVQLRDASPAECAQGGVRVLVGRDADGDGALSGGEVERDTLVCSGDPGTPGQPGTDGRPGASALVTAVAEAPGTNCPRGGVRFDAGLDADRNGQLDPWEVTVTRFVCDGAPGANGFDGLVRTSTRTGPACDAGGVRVETGLDLDRDGVLDDAEVRASRDVCAGSDGITTLVDVAAEPRGASCPAGGTRVSVGGDSDRDGVLDPGEVTDVSFLCASFENLVRIDIEPVGSSTCAAGGSRIEVGLDTNQNGTLDANEVTATTYACSGARGEQGRDTLTLLTPEPAGTQCPAGGQRLDVGQDDDRDGTLSAAEFDRTTYICNGPRGADGRGGSAVRLTPEPAGPNCAAGGTRVETGPDANGNGVLDETPTSTQFACNGTSRNALVRLAAEPAGTACPAGGARVESGLDANGNGTLDQSEITDTTFVCNGTAALPFVVTTASLPNFIAGEPYSQTIGALGGVGSGYTWTVSAGQLPPGLTLTSGTPNATLAGTTQTPGAYTFTVQVQDALGSVAQRALSLTVLAPPCTPGQSGMVGNRVDFVSSPLTATFTEYYAATDTSTAGSVWVGGTSALYRFDKRNGAFENIVSTLPGLGTGQLGYEMLIDGNDVYTLDDKTTTGIRLFRISRNGGRSLAIEDYADFPQAPADDFRGATVFGGSIWMITEEATSTVNTEVWTVSTNATSLPQIATLAFSFSGETSCRGLVVDAQSVYTVCGANLVRVNLTTQPPTATRIVTALPASSSVKNSLVGSDGDGDGTVDFLYYYGLSTNRVPFFCEPDGTVYSGTLATFSGVNYGLALDRVNRALWLWDDTNNRLVRID